jgi:hypothetical protein
MSRESRADYPSQVSLGDIYCSNTGLFVQVTLRELDKTVTGKPIPGRFSAIDPKPYRRGPLKLYRKNEPQRITKVILILSVLFSVMTFSVRADIPPAAHLNDTYKHSIKKPAHNHIVVDPFQVIARKY